MPSPSSPAYHNRSEIALYWAVESATAGVAGTNIKKEFCQNIDWAPVRGIYVQTGYTGKAGSRLGHHLMQRSATVTCQIEYHAAGLGAYALGIAQGNGAEQAVIGSGDPYTHTFKRAVGTNRENSVTIWYNTGDAADTLQFLYGMLTSVAGSIDAESGALILTLTFSAFYPATTAEPTATSYVGSATYPGTPVLGNQGTYTIYNGAGTPVIYANKMTGCDFTMARGVRVFPNGQGLDPGDIGTGELVFDVSRITAEYDSIGAGTIYKDMLDYKKLGDSTHKHVLSWTDADGHVLTITFWPARWNDATTIDYSNEIAVLHAVMDLNDDLASVMQSSAILTQPESVVIGNHLSTAMLT